MPGRVLLGECNHGSVLGLGIAKYILEKRLCVHVCLSGGLGLNAPQPQLDFSYHGAAIYTLYLIELSDLMVLFK